MGNARKRIIVIGGGHAGVEAVCAAARMGAEVVMVTLAPKMIGEMPCNPAIGGIGKGHLVAEIDAVGGIQGWAADRAGIHFRLLNRSRGPAVWGPRAQCDKVRYRTMMTRVVHGMAGVEVCEGEVTRLKTDGGRICGVVLSNGREFEAEAAIVTTGTFLGGLLHTGGEKRKGGRFGERPSVGLGQSLGELGLALRRYKTGTPPRIDRRSIDFLLLEEQGGDVEPRAFSWRTKTVRNKTLCWLARTPEQVQEIIQNNLHRSPLFGGDIEGVGPRYCPSIEDKVVRFPHHRQHTVFVEPETLYGDSMYLNGLATSLPKDVQEQVVRCMPGFKGAKFLRYGYAVEYDVVGSKQVGYDLAALGVPGLYLAGQVVGTSGYEEAAAQGLVAGINAAAKVVGGEGFRPRRETSYIGVLLDDLVNREHREPYRMLTSRAEHRLTLGVDSARERLMKHGKRLGLVRDEAFHVEQRRWRLRADTIEDLEKSVVNPDRQNREWFEKNCGIQLRQRTTFAGVLRRQDVEPERVQSAKESWQSLSPVEWATIVGRVRYQGYLQRHERERDRLQRLKRVKIPVDLRFEEIAGLSREVVEEMRRVRPETLADAEGLAGVTASALALIAGHLAQPSEKNES